MRPTRDEKKIAWIKTEMESIRDRAASQQESWEVLKADMTRVMVDIGKTFGARDPKWYFRTQDAMFRELCLLPDLDPAYAFHMFPTKVVAIHLAKNPMVPLWFDMGTYSEVFEESVLKSAVTHWNKNAMDDDVQKSRNIQKHVSEEMQRLGIPLSTIAFDINKAFQKMIKHGQVIHLAALATYMAEELPLLEQERYFHLYEPILQRD